MPGLGNKGNASVIRFDGEQRLLSNAQRRDWTRPGPLQRHMHSFIHASTPMRSAPRSQPPLDASSFMGVGATIGWTRSNCSLKTQARLGSTSALMSDSVLNRTYHQSNRWKFASFTARVRRDDRSKKEYRLCRVLPGRANVDGDSRQGDCSSGRVCVI